jgi:hypothetical protein
MTINPYQTPEATDSQPPVPRQRYLGFLEYLALAAFFIVAGAATVHRLQLDNLDAYRHSPIISVEVLGVAFLFLLPILFIIQTIWLLFLRKFWRAAVSILFGLISFILTIATMWIDPATIIYMT